MSPPTHLYAQMLATCKECGIRPSDDVLLVSIGEQKLWHFRAGTLHREYPVSTGAAPPSEREGSGGTPQGLHRVVERIGDDAPLGMIFEGRRPTGRIATIPPGNPDEPNRITTRIMRLRGLEPGRNAGPGCDSYERFIYIHGTNREDRIGTPASGGCVVLANHDMLRLFNDTSENTLVWIQR